MTEKKEPEGIHYDSQDQAVNMLFEFASRIDDELCFRGLCYLKDDKEVLYVCEGTETNLGRVIRIYFEPFIGEVPDELAQTKVKHLNPLRYSPDGEYETIGVQTFCDLYKVKTAHTI